MQAVDGIRSDAHGGVKSKGNIRSPNIIINGFGTDTMLTPIAANLAAVFCVPFPPMQTTQSSPIS